MCVECWIPKSQLNPHPGGKHNAASPGWGPCLSFPRPRGHAWGLGHGSCFLEKGGGGISSPCGVGGAKHGWEPPRGPSPPRNPPGSGWSRRPWERLRQQRRHPALHTFLLQTIIYFFFNRYKNRLWNRFRSGSPSGLSAKTGTAAASPSPQTIIAPLQKQRLCTKAPCAAVPAAVESLMPQKQNQNQAPRRPRAAQRPSRATSARSPRPPAAPRPGAPGQRPTGPRLRLLPCPPPRPGGSFLLSASKEKLKSVGVWVCGVELAVFSSFSLFYLFIPPPSGPRRARRRSPLLQADVRHPLVLVAALGAVTRHLGQPLALPGVRVRVLGSRNTRLAPPAPRHVALSVCVRVSPPRHQRGDSRGRRCVAAHHRPTHRD